MFAETAHAPTHAGTASELLDLWEHVVASTPSERADRLLAATYEHPPTSLGAHNAALLDLRARLFGRAQSLSSRCPSCDATTEFTIDCTGLAQALLPASSASDEQHLEADGYRVDFRMPRVADVRAVSARATSDDFAQALLDRCVLRVESEGGATCTIDDLPDSVAEALSARMDLLEPGANVSFDLTCPECGAQSSIGMDCGDVLWSELQVKAERLLLDVDALARAYGWTEPQVLALSATRRAAYLQLIGSG